MKLQDIKNVASKLGIEESDFDNYGHYKAKLNLELLTKLQGKKDGKLILVTAITPTKAGEGKTTTSIALADGLARIGKKPCLALREPSLGPVFGLKGGATGGGKVTVEPSEDINLHFTGDMHALTSSINLISAVLDNSLYQGNPLNIDPSRIVWKRALDMNDRALREITIGLGEKNGVERKDGFVITVASEMMAILCLAENKDDFLTKVGNITVAYSTTNLPIKVKDLKITHAIYKLMREALRPNLVQTAEGNPAIIHGGPFANIAHGCNSIMATKLALKLGDYVVTEAGFGSDLGAEKFLDIKCQRASLKPDLIVMVATIRALKLHGGVPFKDLEKENLECLRLGLPNLQKHLENMKKYHVPLIVAINHFKNDTEAEIKMLTDFCKENNYEVSFQDGFLSGGEGAKDLASKVVSIIESQATHYQPLYDRNEELEVKIERICREIYGASKIDYEPQALEDLKFYKSLGYSNFNICMAKTPLSLSDDPKIVGVPHDFTIHIRSINCSSGAEFLVPLTGEVMTMPGLPKIPAAVKMEDEE